MIRVPELSRDFLGFDGADDVRHVVCNVVVLDEAVQAALGNNTGTTVGVAVGDRSLATNVKVFVTATPV
jgi:transketolase N-terminal domain/subunit